MVEYVQTSGLQVGKPLHDLVVGEIAPGAGIEPVVFWAALANIVAELGPKNRALLDKRDRLQARIDAWHRERRE